MLTPQRRSTKNMLAAEPAKPSVTKTVRVVTGPASSVTGVSRTPGSSIEVFHIRLTPCGAFTAVVVSAGSPPCATAAAAYRMHQARKYTSVLTPWPPARVGAVTAGLAHSRHVSATAAST